MIEATLPGHTLRTLGALMIVIFDVALAKASRAVELVKPLVLPPRDLEVSTRSGALYSGVLLLDRGEVLGGLVVQTGQGLPGPALLAPPAPASSQARLAHWSQDSTDYGDGSWRR